MTNPQMILQMYLRGGGSPAELLATYSVKNKRHGRYPNLVQFKYDQIESPMGSPLVQECRGVILDEDNNWEVVARPFNKFFNHGEGHAAPIDWATARVQEKLDGSLIIMYHYRDEWHVATSGTPDASGEVNGTNQTFAELFWKVWDEMRLGSPRNSHWAHKTYLFELMTPYNRVVVRHEKSRIVFIGLKDRNTGQEFEIGQEEESHDEYDFGFAPEVRVFPLQSTEDIIETFNAMSPLTQEGYVVVDANFNRIKVKHPGYVAIHHMRDGFGPRRMLEVVRSGEGSELLVYYHEWQKGLRRRQRPLRRSGKQPGRGLGPVQGHREPERVRAQGQGPTLLGRSLFARRAGKVGSFRKYFQGVVLKNLAEHLGLKDVEF